MEISEFLKNVGAVRAGGASVGKLKILLYGDPGTGKTHAGATLPQPSLHLLSEGHGDLTVKRVSPDTHIVKIDNYNHLLKILKWLRFTDHGYQSVCMDSITDMQELVRKNMKGGDVADNMSLPDWGRLFKMTEDLIKQFRDLDIHVVVIALAMDTQDDNNRLMFTPAVTGKKLPKKMASFFNIVGFQTKRRMDGSDRPVHLTILDGDDRYVPKTHPALDPVEVPDIATWVEKINNYGEGTIPTEVRIEERRLSEEEQDIVDAENLIRDSEISYMFNNLGATEGARIAAARKYKTREALLAAIQKRLDQR